MALYTDTQLIELQVGQRADRFSFQLLNTDRTPLGAGLLIEADSPPTIQVNTQRTTFRTCSGLVVERPPADLDLDRTRVQPVLTLANGSAYPLGVFMFGIDTRHQYTAGEVWTPELFDETFLLEQDLSRTWARMAGASVLEMFRDMAGEVLDPLGIPTDYQISDLPAASPLMWKVGTPRVTALQALAALLGALPPYFANGGAHTLRPAPSATGQPDHVYGAGTRIFDGTSSTTDSRYKAPNRYIVVGDDVAGVAVRGVYDLPPSHPNSYFATGRIVTADTHVASGVKDAGIAQTMAYVDALTDQATYSTASFTAAADPRHDVFATVQHLGINYLETGWSLRCESGGDHTHQVNRLYA